MQKPHYIFSEIRAELDRQDEKWGEQNHDDGIWALILGEEFGEACMAALEYEFGDSEDPTKHLEEELIQVAAVAIAWVENIRSRRCAK